MVGILSSLAASTRRRQFSVIGANPTIAVRNRSCMSHRKNRVLAACMRPMRLISSIMVRAHKSSDFRAKTSCVRSCGSRPTR